LKPLKPIPPGKRRKPDEIVEEVCVHYGVDPDQVRGGMQYQHLSEPRARIAVELRRQGWSLDGIGRFLGGKDHSTVAYLIRKYGNKGD